MTSVILWIAAALCYGLRPDRFAVITIYPAWTYGMLGLLLAALGASRRAKMRAAVPFLLWFVFLIVFVDQFGALVNFHRWPSRQWQTAHEQGRAIRVVSLNCGGGSALAAAEAFPYEPDIILFQESPPEQALRRLVQDVAGPAWSVACGTDTSIAADGSASMVPLPPAVSPFATRALVTTSQGIEVDVTSLRLLPPVLCLNLLSPDCWRTQTANRQSRREEVAALLRELDGSGSDLPSIVGGDFNAPAGDGSLQALRTRFRDAHSEAGRGLGNTATNDAPLLRVDQVWVDHAWEPASVVVRKTRHSDHRMVICDLVLTDSIDDEWKTPPVAGSRVGLAEKDVHAQHPHHLRLRRRLSDKAPAPYHRHRSLAGGWALPLRCRRGHRPSVRRP